jgi:hypothetical protein
VPDQDGDLRTGGVQPGDIVLFAGKSFPARIVNWYQSIKAGHPSFYNHVALVTSPEGEIFHAARWWVRHSRLRHRCRRCQVEIIRWKQMTPERFRQGMAAVAPMEGRLFPLWRQLLHALSLARIICVGRWAVCSELVARFLQGAGARDRDWCGTNVIDLHDELLGSPSEYEVIFRGRWGDFFKS